MIQRPAGGDRYWTQALRWWEAGAWLLVGLLALLTVASDAASPHRYGSLVLMALLVAGRGALGWLSAHVAARHSYVILLIGVLGGLAFLRDGFGALYFVFLPQFATVSRTLATSIGYSALGAVAITAGGVTRAGWDIDTLRINAVSSLAVWAVGVIIALVTRWARERERLRADLHTTKQELEEVLRREGATQERDRIAREIHDTLAQGFASIVVLAEAARVTGDPRASEQHLCAIELTARENLAEARVLVGSAPATAVASTEVTSALRRTLDRFSKDTGVDVQARLQSIPSDQPTRIALLRCTQEALANVRKHAAASAVRVRLAMEAAHVELEITDDGRGFVVDEARGFGLDGMRRRAAELGGQLNVTSSVGDGTRIYLALPVSREARTP